MYQAEIQVYSFNNSTNRLVNAITYVDSMTNKTGKYYGNLYSTIVYINGKIVKTFQSGKSRYTYRYTTIGDLRVGRNLKYIGKIYDFGLYGIELDEQGIEENWQSSKKYIE